MSSPSTPKTQKITITTPTCCPGGHTLQKSNLTVGWSCDGCKTSQAPSSAVHSAERSSCCSYRCDICDFDLCTKCWDLCRMQQSSASTTVDTTKQDIPYSTDSTQVEKDQGTKKEFPKSLGSYCCPHQGHPLTVFRHSATWGCDLCHTRFDSSSSTTVRSLRCLECDFDVCECCWHTSAAIALLDAGSAAKEKEKENGIAVSIPVYPFYPEQELQKNIAYSRAVATYEKNLRLTGLDEPNTTNNSINKKDVAAPVPTFPTTSNSGNTNMLFPGHHSEQRSVNFATSTTCPQGHPLSTITPTSCQWFCDKCRTQYGGNKGQVAGAAPSMFGFKPPQQQQQSTCTSVRALRCDSCDYDVCEKCWGGNSAASTSSTMPTSTNVKTFAPSLVGSTTKGPVSCWTNGFSIKQQETSSGSNQSQQSMNFKPSGTSFQSSSSGGGVQHGFPAALKTQPFHTSTAAPTSSKTSNTTGSWTGGFNHNSTIGSTTNNTKGGAASSSQWEFPQQHQQKKTSASGFNQASAPTMSNSGFFKKTATNSTAQKPGRGGFVLAGRGNATTTTAAATTTTTQVATTGGFNKMTSSATNPSGGFPGRTSAFPANGQQQVSQSQNNNRPQSQQSFFPQSKLQQQQQQFNKSATTSSYVCGNAWNPPPPAATPALPGNNGGFKQQPQHSNNKLNFTSSSTTGGFQAMAAPKPSSLDPNAASNQFPKSKGFDFTSVAAKPHQAHPANTMPPFNFS